MMPEVVAMGGDVPMSQPCERYAGDAPVAGENLASASEGVTLQCMDFAAGEAAFSLGVVESAVPSSSHDMIHDGGLAISGEAVEPMGLQPWLSSAGEAEAVGIAHVVAREPEHGHDGELAISGEAVEPMGLQPLLSSAGEAEAVGIAHVDAREPVQPVLGDAARPAGGAGDRASSLVDLVAAGRRRAEVAQDVAEARRLQAWLTDTHPGWARSASTSRIADAGLAVEQYAKRGAAYCRQARCGVESYEAFCAQNATLIAGGDPYPPTEELVAWFALWRLDATRALKARTGVPFKGTSGKGAVKALGYACNLFAAPFPPEMLKTDIVALAILKPPDAVENGTDVAHAGVHVQFWLEGIAAGRFPDGAAASEIEADYACAFAILGVTSLRTVEGLRSRVKAIDADRGQALLHCAGGKTPKKANMRPFDVGLPTGGFTTGFGAVVQAFLKRYTGRDCIFRGFRRARKRGAAGPRTEADPVADGWATPHACAEPDMVVDMFFALMHRCGMTRAQCRACGLTPYGLRHILPDLTRAAGWGLEERMELGRWSVAVLRSLVMAAHADGGTRHATRQAAANLSTACANLYSRGAAAFDREIALRVRALDLVRGFVGARAWTEVVPVAKDAPPSFAFMFGEPPAPPLGDGEGDVDLPEDVDDLL